MIRKILVGNSVTRIRCNYYPEGTKLYWTKEKGFLELSPEKIPGFEGTSIVRKGVWGNNLQQVYIPANRMVTQSGLYDIVPTETGLEVHLVKRDSQPQERTERRTGEIIRSCGVHGIYLNAKDAKQLHVTGYLKIHISLSPTIYATAEPISPEEYEILPSQKDFGGFLALRNLSEFTYKYTTSIEGQGATRLSLPISFMEKAGFGTLRASWEGSKLVISGQDRICPSCGKIVHVKDEGLYPAHVCSRQAKKKPQERKRMNMEQKEQVLQQLQQMEAMYKKMEETL